MTLQGIDNHLEEDGSNTYVAYPPEVLARTAGITKRVHPHGLRHTHAFELMMEGVPMRIIQQQLGHTSLATTDRYLAHIAPREVIQTMQEREWSP